MVIYLETNIRQTSKWQLKGQTYQEDNTFHFVGDLIEEKIQLVFDVNGVQKTVEVPKPLKSLKEHYDEIKNGVAHYNIGDFEVNQYTILSYDPSWLQTPETAVCYCHLPYDARSNTPILCDKLDVISDMITRSQGCGVKVINKVLAIRLPIETLGIETDDTPEIFLGKFTNYLQDNPFRVLYCLDQTENKLLENYAFDIQSANNNITCETLYKPSYFNIEYPLDVIINSTVDLEEMQRIAEEVLESKKLIEEIKKEIDDKTSTTTDQYNKILEIQKLVQEQSEKIDKIYETVTSSQEEVQQALKQVNQLKEEITALVEEIRVLADEIKGALDTHNQDALSHPDIRAMITESSGSANQNITKHNNSQKAHPFLLNKISEVQTEVQTQLTTHNTSGAAHNDIRTLIQNHKDSSTDHNDIREKIAKHETSDMAHTDIRSAITKHAGEKTAHPDIRELINTHAADETLHQDAKTLISIHDNDSMTHGDIRESITNHAKSEIAHQDIRELITNTGKKCITDFGAYRDVNNTPRLQVRRGIDRNLPTLNEGELGFSTDNYRFYIGSDNQNIAMARLDEIENKLLLNSNTIKSLDVLANTKNQVVTGFKLIMQQDETMHYAIEIDDAHVKMQSGETLQEAFEKIVNGPSVTPPSEPTPAKEPIYKTLQFEGIWQGFLNLTLLNENQVLAEGELTLIDMFAPQISQLPETFIPQSQKRLIGINDTEHALITINNKGMLTIQKEITNTLYIQGFYNLKDIM